MRNAAPDRSGVPYRSRNGTVFGVCHGLAAHFQLPVYSIQAMVCIGAVFTGFWPMAIIYVGLALLMKPEPVLPFENAGEAEFYNSYASSRGMALQRLRQTMDNLDRRIQRIETIVTARGYAWEQKLNGK